MVVRPPSTGKSHDLDEAENAGDLTEVGQAFIDAVFRHNGRPAPRPFEIAHAQHIVAEPSSEKLAQIKALTGYVPPENYEDWLRVGMAIYNETGGSDEGLDLFDQWSSKGKTYKGRQEIEAKWRSFKTGQERPVTIGTLIKMATDNGADWTTICDKAGPQFKRCETVTTSADTPPAEVLAKNSTPVKPGQVINRQKFIPKRKTALDRLDDYSLRGRSNELERSVIDAKPVLGELALLGQATVLFAAPNTGKTLITLGLLIEAVKENRVDPS
ncbi:MAG: PriCT-2 domain-containing protein, partial [Deltaproteobacteria bacterium]|nr:PriCT-2 domain-containing protein [Deltaproteobacteria bacterium]